MANTEKCSKSHILEETNKYFPIPSALIFADLLLYMYVSGTEVVR